MYLPETTYKKVDPRGDLPHPTIDPPSFLPRTAEAMREHRRRSAHAVGETQKARKHQHRRTCYDWIFSTASNVHLATDHTSFKTYTPFKSHVLALADQRQVPVLGVGTVVLHIRRQPGSKDSHAVTLENVLHVPSWICNVFSDIYFEPVTAAFEHTWTDSGLTFMKRQDPDGRLAYWGFTEEFCGLERLVLAKEGGRGRSPMPEDKDREVFSVSVTWPQGQRDRYDEFLQKQGRVEGKLQERDGNAVRRSTQVERNGKV